MHSTNVEDLQHPLAYRYEQLAPLLKPLVQTLGQAFQRS